VVSARGPSRCPSFGRRVCRHAPGLLDRLYVVVLGPWHGGQEHNAPNFNNICTRTKFEVSSVVVEVVNNLQYVGSDVDSSSYRTPEIIRRIGFASSVLFHYAPVRLCLDSGGRVGWVTVLFTSQFVCPIVTAICFWNMDSIESWYSETGGLSCANTRSSGMNLSRLRNSPPSHSCRPQMKL